MEKQRQQKSKPLQIITNLFTRRREKSSSSSSSSCSSVKKQQQQQQQQQQQNNIQELQKQHGYNNQRSRGSLAPPSMSDDVHLLDCSLTRSTGDLELEALHISRQDNPYLQIISSQDGLDYSDQDQSMLSPEPYSPTRSCDILTLSEIHSHLVRSPPPVSWPISPRSNGTFSPESCEDEPYTRSHSEEHILSPCRDLLRSGLFSPVRGATPDMSGSGIVSPSIFRTSSPRYRSKSNTQQQQHHQQQHHNQPVWRNMSTSGDESLSPKNINDGAMMTVITTVTNKHSGESFFSSWNYRKRKSNIKSMENLQNVDFHVRQETRKSFSTLGEATETAKASPRTKTTRFSLKKSITLRSKRGPSYIDIESQS